MGGTTGFAACHPTIGPWPQRGVLGVLLSDLHYSTTLHWKEGDERPNNARQFSELENASQYFGRVLAYFKQELT